MWILIKGNLFNTEHITAIITKENKDNNYIITGFNKTGNKIILADDLDITDHAILYAQLKETLHVIPIYTTKEKQLIKADIQLALEKNQEFENHAAQEFKNHAAGDQR